MNDDRSRMTVWSFIKGLFKVIIGLSLLAQSILFLIVLVFMITVLSSVSSSLSGKGETDSPFEIPDGGALVINPAGTLVEQAPPADVLGEAIASAFGASVSTQISVHELVSVLRNAAIDDRIEVVVLDLQNLYIPSISASKAHYVAAEVEKVREAGKRVVAVGDYYSQEQYLIASEADTILLHDFGAVAIEGYGVYNNYFASALEKLKVNTHVFRVGTFKAAVEPMIRDDMSPEAAEANRAFISVLWDQYTRAIDDNRELQSGGTETYADTLPALVDRAGNSMAVAALDAGLVDHLMDRPTQRAFIADLVGIDQDSDVGAFRGVGYRTYKISTPGPEIREGSDKVAIVTVAGAIIDGEDVTAGAPGDEIARQLRRARFRDDVKAVVLRVDSPGGSAFASEVMRDELLKLKAAGKPVVVSMGSLAASGGYWISANGDEIWAAPTTVTGSIGVFGLLPTFENTLAEVGVFTDGVGTTPLTAIRAAGAGPLPEAYADVIQSSVEEVYERFLNLVAEGRGLRRDQVDEIGQGRVWIGSTAQQIKLVDRLGTIDDAIAAAAERAGLEDYDQIGLVEEKTGFELFLEGLTGSQGEDISASKAVDIMTGGGSRVLDMPQLVRIAAAQIRDLASYNDPNAVYVRCIQCPPTY